MTRARRLKAGLFWATLLWAPAAGAQSATPLELQQSLAGRIITHAVDYCGYEATTKGRALSVKVFGTAHANNQKFADNLWRGTFACAPAYIGASCMAARWSLCQRTFAEYGPDGIILPGLLKPIILK
ncbi:MAG: hypothetical protein AAGF81_03730 [Pseudomonadota bacterium]